MFHYSLVSGGREFQPVCLAIKGTMGQIVSGSQALLRNGASPPSSQSMLCLQNPAWVPLRQGTRLRPHRSPGERVAGQAQRLLPMDLQHRENTTRAFSTWFKHSQ